MFDTMQYVQGSSADIEITAREVVKLCQGLYGTTPSAPAKPASKFTTIRTVTTGRTPMKPGIKG